MKSKYLQFFLICVVVSFTLFNIKLLMTIHDCSDEVGKLKNEIEYLENIDFIFQRFKDITMLRFEYDLFHIGESNMYLGSNNKINVSITSIVDQPKLILGLNQNMCRPCVEGAFEIIKELYPDFETNSNILCIADIEQRFKDDYYGKQVVSFQNAEDFPLYNIDTKPYFFVLDKDLTVKRLFVTDDANPEVTREYLKIINEHYKIGEVISLQSQN